MPTAKKEATVAELTEKLSRAKVTIVADYRGLSVADSTRLRTTLRGSNIEYQVAKNTLTRIAANQAGYPVMDELLVGPTAIAFGYDDVVTPAKLMSDFARTSRILKVKGGVLGQQVLNAEDVAALAATPPLEQLRATLVGNLQGPASSLVGVLNGALASLVYTLEGRASQLSEGEAAA
ncbi:MAG: 50S ribosomal protein L10 [Chloroflexi bacterium]|nr:50S ribosomal protein L10 [Chloroflexota bacterium]